MKAHVLVVLVFGVLSSPVKAADFSFAVAVQVNELHHVGEVGVLCTVFDGPGRRDRLGAGEVKVRTTSSSPYSGSSASRSITVEVDAGPGKRAEDATRWECGLRLYRSGVSWRDPLTGDRVDRYNRREDLTPVMYSPVSERDCEGELRPRCARPGTAFVPVLRGEF